MRLILIAAALLAALIATQESAPDEAGTFQLVREDERGMAAPLRDYSNRKECEDMARMLTVGMGPNAFKWRCNRITG